jgi:hypothetical protein
MAKTTVANQGEVGERVWKKTNVFSLRRFEWLRMEQPGMPVAQCREEARLDSLAVGALKRKIARGLEPRVANFTQHLPRMSNAREEGDS